MSMTRLFCLLTLLLAATQSAAQDDNLRRALIIGISSYADPRVPNLPGVASDMDSARQIALAMGIPASGITVLRDAQATKQNIVAQLNTLGRQVGDGGRVLVYFSGHGTRWQDAEAGGCVEGLFTHDSQAIVNREFAALAQPIGDKADKLIIMFDACHSGGVGTLRGLNRSTAGSEAMRAKFFVKADEAPNSCSRPANVRTRSLLGVREGVRDPLQDNVVQITSSRPDEVSFDEAGKGGLATQGVRDCLLGKAKDLDGSGAITLDEVEACAQDVVREKLRPFPDLLPHHISVRGLRNLIPVAVPAKPAEAAPVPVAVPETVTADSAKAERERLQREQAERAERDRVEELRLAAQRAEQARLEQQSLSREQALAEAQRLAAEQAQRLAAEAAQRLAAAASDVAREAARQAAGEAARQAASQAANQTASQAARPPPPAPPPVAAIAALRNLHDQRDPRRTVVARPSRDQLKIGTDLLELTVNSSHDGYLYIVLLGSDETSFYLLFPNAFDKDNRIRAKVATRLPRPSWQVQASGPAGTDKLLVIVSEQPRDLSALKLAPASAAEPFTYTAADLPGRSKLINFMIGEGVRKGSARFGADWVTIEEIR